jgi:hypothetical protein
MSTLIYLKNNLSDDTDLQNNWLFSEELSRRT